MTHTVFENPSIDIHKIIDDAMEKKDRNVTIFISGENTSVYIRPEEKSMWVKKNGWYKCPECQNESRQVSIYCPNCGEKMYGVKTEGER
jgi:uncharacterized Zn finger protein (UPF0148 family)